MSERRLLALVLRYPHPSALARHVRSSAVWFHVGRLESCGLVTRRGDLYRVTKRGRNEIAMGEAIVRLVARSFG